jgi:hypothetical protein
MTTTVFHDEASPGLVHDLEAAMRAGVSEPWAPGRFEALALRVFRHQFALNRPYRALCEARGTTPDNVTTWSETPAVPVAAFKVLELVCGRPGDAERLFRTSGTTGGAEARGVHLVPALDVYRSSLLPPFRAHVVPDVDRIRFVSLIPSPSDLPDSSLSFMVGAAAESLASEVAWAVDGEGRFDIDMLDRALRGAREAGEPVLLLGTAFAFVHALDRQPAVLGRLPDGSRIMETGGFKGRAREMPKSELYALLTARTGVPRERIVNEYGMTELLSQLYEPVLSAGLDGADVHRPPPWLAVRALDPTTLAPLAEGEEGLLSFFDLANVGSVSHILTEDVGSVVGGRVRLVGRTPGAEPRGCSRAMDELMAVVR